MREINKIIIHCSAVKDDARVQRPADHSLSLSKSVVFASLPLRGFVLPAQ